MAGCCSALYFLNLKGDVLIQRIYRGRCRVRPSRRQLVSARGKGRGTGRQRAAGLASGDGRCTGRRAAGGWPTPAGAGQARALRPAAPPSRAAARRRNLGAAFRTHILNAKDGEGSASATPVRVLGSCSFLYMRSSDVYILAVTRNNANAMLTFQFMSNVRPLLCARALLPCATGSRGSPRAVRAQIVTLFKSYFGGEFSEQSIKGNFVLIYELLDETLDFGFPQARRMKGRHVHACLPPAWPVGGAQAVLPGGCG